MGFYGFRPYVPVAQRRWQAQKETAKLTKSGRVVSPIVIEGRKIAQNFWGKAWCDNLERYSDFESRLPRGRTYVRNGSVVDLQIERGKVEALVSGSEIYKVKVDVDVAAPARWKAICRDCAGSIGSLIELLQGKLSKNVMERVCREADGLFPAPPEIKMSCSCPDWADMCKHVAATLYGVGARLELQSRPHLHLARGRSHRTRFDGRRRSAADGGRSGERTRARRRRRRGAVRHRNGGARRAAREAKPRGKKEGARASRGARPGSSEEARAGEDQSRSRSGEGADRRRCGGASQGCEIDDRQAEDGERRREADAPDETAGACSAPIGAQRRVFCARLADRIRPPCSGCFPWYQGGNRENRAFFAPCYREKPFDFRGLRERKKALAEQTEQDHNRQIIRGYQGRNRRRNRRNRAFRRPAWERSRSAKFAWLVLLYTGIKCSSRWRTTAERPPHRGIGAGSPWRRKACVPRGGAYRVSFRQSFLASDALSKMCGATPRFSSDSPSFIRQKPLVV